MPSSAFVEAIDAYAVPRPTHRGEVTNAADCIVKGIIPRKEWTVLGQPRTLRRRFRGLRFDRVTLRPHLLQEGVDRRLKLLPE